MIPWGKMTNKEVIEAIENGQRMPIPKTFGPESIIELMNECWKEEPNQRPNFQVNLLF